MASCAEVVASIFEKFDKQFLNVVAKIQYNTSQVNFDDDHKTISRN